MAVLIDKIKGHDAILATLRQQLSGNPQGRSFLFAGPSGVGKKKTSLALAQLLFCEKHPQVCGLCPSCLRVEKGSHENLLVIEPEGGQIRIDEARRVLDFLSFKSLGRYRVVIIDEAHRMNPAAANALLKILEEPPENTFFFLISSSGTSLLPTIRSRSLKILFHAVRPEDMVQAVSAPAWAIQSSRGQFDRLMQKSQSEDREQVAAWGNILVRFLTDPEVLSDMSWRENLKDRSRQFERNLTWMELLRDALWFKMQRHQELIHPDLKEVLLPLSALSEDLLMRAFDQMLSFEKDFAFNRDPVLMSEQFIVEMRPSVVVN